MRLELLQEEEKRNRIETKIQEAFRQRSDNLWRKNPVIDNSAADRSDNFYLDKNQKIAQRCRDLQRREQINQNFEIRSRQQGRIAAPVQFISKLLTTWNLAERDAAWLLGFEETEEIHVENIMSGRAPLTGRDVKDRIACLFEIRRALSAWLQDDAVENEWLREPHRLLDDQSPMNLLREGSMENLFVVREYIGMATGG